MLNVGPQQVALKKIPKLFEFAEGSIFTFNSHKYYHKYQHFLTTPIKCHDPHSPPLHPIIYFHFPFCKVNWTSDKVAWALKGRTTGDDHVHHEAIVWTTIPGTSILTRFPEDVIPSTDNSIPSWWHSLRSGHNLFHWITHKPWQYWSAQSSSNRKKG